MHARLASGARLMSIKEQRRTYDTYTAVVSAIHANDNGTLTYSLVFYYTVALLPLPSDILYKELFILYYVYEHTYI